MLTPPFARRFLHRLHDDERGSVSTVVAVMILVLTVMVGLAIDSGRVFLAQDRLSHAVDDAGLAVAAGSLGYTAGEGSCSDTYLTNIAAKYVAANFNTSLGPSQNLTVCQSTDGTTIAVSAQVKVPMTFMGIIGYTNMVAAVNTEVKGSVSGLEVVMVLDNTGSMTSPMTSCSRTALQSDGSSYNQTAFGCLLNASYALVNTLFGVGSGTTAVATPPASVSTLFFGLVPFTNVVNPLNTTATTLNGATLTQYNQILGNDWKVTVGQIVNVTPANFSSGGLPLCAYNGTWAPASNDYIQPMDLIHLAQDICSLYVSSSIDILAGTESFISGAPNLNSFYLADWLNTASSSITGAAGPGMNYNHFAWEGCVEERASKGDPVSTAYYDYNIAAGWTYAEYDHGPDYNGISSGTTPTPDYLWHIWRQQGRNASYLGGPGLPHSATFKSAWYNGTPTTAVYRLNGYYYKITNYNYPNPFYSIIACTSITCATTQTGSIPLYYFAGPTVQLSGMPLTYISGTPPVSNAGGADSTNFYYSRAPDWRNGDPNSQCVAAPVLPLDGNYTDITTALSAMHANDETDQEPAMAWAARVLGYDGSGYHPPFLQSQAIDATSSSGAAGWRKAIVFLTDGTPNLADNDYSAFSMGSTGGTTGPWAQTNLASSGVAYANPPLAALGDPNDPVNLLNVNLPAAGTNTFTLGCGYTNSETSQTSDQGQVMCRTYQLCKQLRGQDYYIFSVFFQDSQNITTNMTVFMTDCTADGNGNIDATKVYTATDQASLTSAFSAIASQLINLRISR